MGGLKHGVSAAINHHHHRLPSNNNNNRENDEPVNTVTDVDTERGRERERGNGSKRHGEPPQTQRRDATTTGEETGF